MEPNPRAGDHEASPATPESAGVATAERRLAFLAEASGVLGSSLEYDRTLTSLTRLLVPLLADWCSVDMLERDGSIRRIAVAHADPARAEIARTIRQYPPDPEGRHPRTRVLQSGRPLLAPRISDADLAAAAGGAEQLRIMRELGYTSVMIVPLVARGETLGALTFAMAESGRHYGPSDLAFAEDLARRAALALDNARLYGEAQHAIAEREAALVKEQAARAEAEAANHAKDAFLATLSHELRSPLNAIFTWTQLLRSGKLAPARTAHALETIERNTRLQVRLIEDLLDVSRINAGKLSLELATVDLDAVTSAAVELLVPTAEATQVTLTVVPVSEPLIVRGDPARLQQVLSNLIANAIKFTPAGGRVEVRLTRREHEARVVVCDTGAGIAPEFLPHIFEPFRQADTSSTRAHGGLGLGLAIVHHLVEAHGGRITAESAGCGQGTTFTVALPREAGLDAGRVAAVERDQTPPDDSVLRGVRVLVVDDDAGSQELIATVLAQSGAKVAIAGSARQALAMLEGDRPDVLLSDIAMPDEDGYSLLRRVRALSDERGGRIPAIALTAYAGGDERRRALAAGFARYLAKPVGGRQLVAVVAALARGGEAPARTGGLGSPVD
jgi:signal transduction histidine kinase/ActR/RegA family two-component response regulator